MTVDYERIIKDKQKARDAAKELVSRAAELDATLERADNAYRRLIEQEAVYNKELLTQNLGYGVADHVERDFDKICLGAVNHCAPYLAGILNLPEKIAKRRCYRARNAVIQRIPDGYKPTENV